MKFRPLWMAKFLPTNSGTTVQARAQVRIGSRLPVDSARYTFSSSRSTTYGPFFSERPITLLPRGGKRRFVVLSSDLQLAVPDAPAAADDGGVRWLAAASGLAPLGELAGRRARVPA